tara:strand:+ start:320 stop:520 length:201 start_codon:yes stop_codon:yes gene_type:complete
MEKDQKVKELLSNSIKSAAEESGDSELIEMALSLLSGIDDNKPKGQIEKDLALKIQQYSESTEYAD